MFAFFVSLSSYLFIPHVESAVFVAYSKRLPALKSLPHFSRKFILPPSAMKTHSGGKKAWDEIYLARTTLAALSHFSCPKYEKKGR